ncbi:MAG: heme-degrading monooxygenase HmoA [Planctomycetota bacterium]|jgi:heme-degrading monooxygenase HmoA
MAPQVVRSWVGVTTRGNAAPYLSYLRAETVPHLQALPGFVGVQILQRAIDDGLEFRVQTTWQSMVSIHAFAGDDLEVAVVPLAAQAVLLRFDAEVVHYEVTELS